MLFENENKGEIGMKTTQRVLSLRLLLTLAAALTLMLCMTVQASAKWTVVNYGFDPTTEWDGQEKTGLTLFSQREKYYYSNSSEFFYRTVYGLKDSAGNVVLPAKYWSIEYAGPNRLIVQKHTTGPMSSYGIIDLKGNAVYPFADQMIEYKESLNLFLVEKSSQPETYGNALLLDSSFHEVGRFPNNGLVNDWGKGFFYWDSNDGSSIRTHALYRVEGSSFITIAPKSEHRIKLLIDGELKESYFGSNTEICDLYNEDGKCILSGTTYQFALNVERGYIIAQKFKKPEYDNNNYTYTSWNGTRVDKETGDPVCYYGLVNFHGEEILPFAYDKMAFTEDGVEFGNWTGERRLEQLSYGFSGSTPPTYYVYIFDTKTLTFDELKEYQPKLTDVPASAWYYDAVQWAADKTMIDGTARRLYPDDNAPRGEVIEYMWKAAGRPTPTISNPFTDVSASDSYYNAVLWAYQQGVTTGTSAVTFAPAETCTRAQVVTFLWRAMKGAETEAESAFADVGADAYYASPVAWAVDKSITNGTSATTFSPDATCTRAQILTFLYRAYTN